MDTIIEQIEQIEQKIFVCEVCDYTCSKKSNYERHILTDRHKRIQLKYKNDTKNEQIEQNTYICNCGKKYKFSQGLSKHKKVCNFKNIEKTKTELNFTNNNIIIEIINENRELKKLLFERNK